MAPDLFLDIRRDAQGNEFLYFPTMFVSDVHLGSKHARAKRLSHALEHTIAGKLYAVGDIVDGEYLLKKEAWRFGPWHRQVLAHVFRKADGESDTTYIPGNHDIRIRSQTVKRGEEELLHHNLCGKSLYGVKVREDATHIGPDGLVIKVIHGDQYDPTLERLSDLGNAALEIMSHVDTVFKQLPGCSHISLASLGKKAVKKIVDKKWGIRKNIAKNIDSDPHFDGIVTGHSHMSEISRTPDGKLLLNDGCCTDHVEFLVQDKNGVWALLEWHQTHLKITQEAEIKKGKQIEPSRVVTWKELGVHSFDEPPKMIEDKYTQKTDRIIRLIYRMWPPKERQRLRGFMNFKAAAGQTTVPTTAQIPLPNPRHENKAVRARATDNDALTASMH